MILPALYHWSPSDRRFDIYKVGLVPESHNVIASVQLSYVCLSPTPATAWTLSGGSGITSEIHEWDLWQIRLSENDNVAIRPEFGYRVREINVRNVITPDRIWYVGSRTV